MTGLLAKAALLVALTHGLRGLGRLVGPRRGGLILGLPCSTAVVLLACGQEHGVADAAVMAESSLLALVGVVALPLTYAWVVARGWTLPRAPLAAVFAYAAVACGFSVLPAPGAFGSVGIAAIGVITASLAAGRMPETKSGRGAIAPSRLRCLALRTAVPVICLAAVAALRAWAGPRWAGLLSPFPGMSLAVLVVTHLEAGPAEASRMARALPPGCWGMIAFLVAFRFGSPVMGLGWATVFGYLLAAAALLAVEALTRWSRPSPVQVVVDRRRRKGVISRWELAVHARPLLPRPSVLLRSRGRRGAPCRRLSPLVEPIGF